MPTVPYRVVLAIVVLDAGTVRTLSHIIHNADFIRIHRLPFGTYGTLPNASSLKSNLNDS